MSPDHPGFTIIGLISMVMSSYNNVSESMSLSGAFYIISCATKMSMIFNPVVMNGRVNVQKRHNKKSQFPHSIKADDRTTILYEIRKPGILDIKNPPFCHRTHKYNI